MAIRVQPERHFYVCDVCEYEEEDTSLLRMLPGWTRVWHACTEEEAPWPITSDEFYWATMQVLMCPKCSARTFAGLELANYERIPNFK